MVEKGTGKLFSRIKKAKEKPGCGASGLEGYG